MRNRLGILRKKVLLSAFVLNRNRRNIMTDFLVVYRACVVAGTRTVATVGCVTAPCISSFQKITDTANGVLVDSEQMSSVRSVLIIREFSAISAIVVPFETIV